MDKISNLRVYRERKLLIEGKDYCYDKINHSIRMLKWLPKPKIVKYDIVL